ncbi:MAG TPA: hypothetical protein VE956_20090 [Nodularia sp. (in: cyanobacteria)]|nr:hypothetical protein [Nodularia sp. (in: cyanobacteria)]
MEPTLQQVFGAGATLSPTQLIIDLQNLAANGLNVSTPPKAEALLVALIIQARTTLTLENFEANIDQSIYTEDGFSTVASRGENAAIYKIEPIIFNLAKLNAPTILDPNAY